MIRVLFLIHDLGQGGAEKVLVNLVNNMDRKKFDISVTVLFGGGINEQFLASDIHLRTVFKKEIPANSKIMKILSPKQLHSLCVKEHYDIEISYLEGPSARIISGCEDPNTKLISWVHCTMTSIKDVSASFRSKIEAKKCYNRMHRMVFVSEGVRSAFVNICGYKGKTVVLYNTIESDEIQKQSQEEVSDLLNGKIGLIAVGTLKEVKGFDRLLRIVKRLKDDHYPVHLYLLGIGPMKKFFEQYISENGLEDSVSLLGYQTNPYKYVSKCDLFVCSSYAEGFSTAATEALIVGTPVCTVNVSGMREMLGDNNEYGIVTENSEEALYSGIKALVSNPELLEYYREMASKRGKKFNTESTVIAVENLFEEVVER